MKLGSRILNLLIKYFVSMRKPVVLRTTGWFVSGINPTASRLRWVKRFSFFYARYSHYVGVRRVCARDHDHRARVRTLCCRQTFRRAGRGFLGWFRQAAVRLEERGHGLSSQPDSARRLREDVGRELHGAAYGRGVRVHVAPP